MSPTSRPSPPSRHSIEPSVGLAPISDPTARRLILGSMPGVASLRRQQYYAHPQNHFWRLMAQIVEFDAAAPYADCVQALSRSGVALWDVLQSCARSGSLDRAIQRGTRVPNDFPGFLDRHPHLELVCFNGTEAEQSFQRFVLPQIKDRPLTYRRLPSSSAAHAIPFERKADQWRRALDVMGGVIGDETRTR